MQVTLTSITIELPDNTIYQLHPQPCYIAEISKDSYNVQTSLHKT